LLYDPARSAVTDCSPKGKPVRKNPLFPRIRAGFLLSLIKADCKKIARQNAPGSVGRY
jgi:hypothetical protein